MTLFRVPMRLFTALLILLAFALVYGLFRMMPSPQRAGSQSNSPPVEVSVPAPDSPEWQTVNWNPGYHQVNLSAPSTVTPLPPPTLDMPPGDYCSYISQITGQPCLWNVRRVQYESGDEMYEIELRSGDQVLARGSALRVHLNELIEVTKTYPSTHGWLDYIEVARWLERAGFGRLMLQAIDQILLRESGGNPVVKVFVDAAGWAARVVPSGADRFGEKVYIYLVNTAR